MLMSASRDKQVWRLAIGSAIASLLVLPGCGDEGSGEADSGFMTGHATETIGETATADGSGGMMDTGAVDTGATDTGATDTGETDAGASETDTTAGDGDCADYRTAYPQGPYGTTIGSVLADVPGMVLGDGTPVNFDSIYRDKTKVALVLANAFDT